MIYLLYELIKTYFVKIIKLFCEVNHVVLCSKTLINYSINVCPYDKFWLLFVRLQLYREVYVFVISFHSSHIDTNVLTDGTYELIPDFEGAGQEAQANAATLTKDPDQSPEEPKADLASDYREGKPRT